MGSDLTEGVDGNALLVDDSGCRGRSACYEAQVPTVALVSRLTYPEFDVTHDEYVDIRSTPVTEGKMHDEQQAQGT